jgi:hypothetical protein
MIFLTEDIVLRPKCSTLVGESVAISQIFRHLKFNSKKLLSSKKLKTALCLANTSKYKFMISKYLKLISDKKVNETLLTEIQTLIFLNY